MRYNNFNQNKRRTNNGGYKPRHVSAQNYVWRVEWCNSNVKNGAWQRKAFRSKTEALIFKTKLENNPNNYVLSYIEKITI